MPTQEAGYRELPHTADAGLFLWGTTPADVVAQGLIGMTALMVDMSRAAQTQRRDLEATGDSLGEALREFLGAVLLWFEMDDQIVTGVDNLTVDPGTNTIRASLHIDTHTPSRYPLETLIKAVTYHQLTFRQTASRRWEATVVFDL